MVDSGAFTPSRSDEVRNATWAEFGWETATWEILA